MRLRQGSVHYELPTDLDLPSDMNFRGGYSPNNGGCNELEREVSAENTVISVDEPVYLYFGRDVSIEGITFDFEDDGLLEFTMASASTARVDFERNRIVGGTSNSYALAFDTVSEHELTVNFINNIVAGVSGAPAVHMRGGLIADVFDSYVGPSEGRLIARVEQNTFVGNEGPLVLKHVPVAVIKGNIVWDNTPSDTYTPCNASGGICVVEEIPGFIDLEYNILQPGKLGAGAVLDVQNIATDPNLDAMFSPQAGSPAIDSGPLVLSAAIPEQDAVGKLRISGGRIDRGALESDFEGSSSLVVTTSDDTVLKDEFTSLREAMLRANETDGSDTITFDVDEKCPSLIKLESPLPPVTESLKIDGYSQGGSPNSVGYGFNAEVCVEIVASDPAATELGLHVPSSAPNETRLEVVGVGLQGFLRAISLEGGNSHRIAGNRMGAAIQNATNVFVGSTVPGVRIGGAAKSSRNLLGGAESSIVVDGASTKIINNLVGLAPSGMADASYGNRVGIELRPNATNPVVENNVVGNNLAAGIEVNGSQNSTIRFNRVGWADCDQCEYPAANGRGIRIRGAAQRSELLGNKIGNNAGAGVSIASSAGEASLFHEIYYNSIVGNGGLGVDHYDDGFQQGQNADPLEPETAPNRGINAPVLTGISVNAGGASGSAGVELSSRNGSYNVWLYASDDCGLGQGEEPVGVGSVTIFNGTPLANGSAQFPVPLASSKMLSGRYFTAIAIDSVGNSSEFSNCQPAG